MTLFCRESSLWKDPCWPDAELAPSSRRSYHGAVLYWATWHRVRTKAPLSVLGAYPRPISESIIEEFIDDHRSVTCAGQVTHSMERRQVLGMKLAGVCSPGLDCCPDLAYWRLRVMRRLHLELGLDFGTEVLAYAKQRLKRAWMSAKRNRRDDNASGDVDSSLGELLRLCGTGAPGVQGRAMIVLLKYLRAQQLVETKLEDLIIVRDHGAGSAEDVALWIRMPLNEIQFAKRVLYPSPEESALLIQWWQLRVLRSSRGMLFPTVPHGSEPISIENILTWLSHLIQSASTHQIAESRQHLRRLDSCPSPSGDAFGLPLYEMTCDLIS